MPRNSIMRSFANAQAFMVGCRDPLKGRKVNAPSRLYPMTDCKNPAQVAGYCLMYGNRPILTITPDDIITFVTDNERAYGVAASLATTLHRAFPCAWNRKAYKRFEIIGGDAPYYNSDSRAELFDGLQYCLKTRKFLNAKPPLHERVDTEKRKEWLAIIKRFRKNIRLRAKIGVFDAIVNDVLSEFNGDRFAHQAGRPNWEDQAWRDLLYNSIINDEYPIELMRGFALSGMVYAWHSSKLTGTPAMALEAAISVLDSESVYLRQRFGVFNDN